MTSTTETSPHKESFIRKYLDPVDSMSETVFGLIMVLGITSTASLYVEGSSYPAWTLMVAAIGCNLAWGIVDGVMYVVTSLFSRSRSSYILRLIRHAPDANVARAVIARRLGKDMGDLLRPDELMQLAGLVYDGVERIKEERIRTRLTGDDVLGGFATFVAEFISTFPAVLPFLFISNWLIALRLSNLLTVITLFVVGYNLARYNGGNKWLLGLSLMIVGIVLVAITIALGG
jgi:VIT1/CCC1 family predicted Fe2+/Mn2+ transporter